MDHPHIARLLDAGTTESGAPFFVMAVVRGVPQYELLTGTTPILPETLKKATLDERAASGPRAGADLAEFPTPFGERHAQCDGDEVGGRGGYDIGVARSAPA